mgnify:CR=1 FL=1
MKKLILTITALVLTAGVVMAQEKNTTITVSKTEQEVKEEAGKTVETSTTATEIEHENTVLVNDFGKNWEISLGLGTQTYLGEYSGSHQKFLDLWTGPAIDFNIQKWTSPYFAIGLGMNFSPYRGLYSVGDDKATFRQDDDPLYKDKKGGESLYLAGSKLNRWYGNFFATFSFDILNICCGYRPDRMYHLIGYLGGGVAVALNSSVYTSCTGSFNAGLINQFNINDRWSLNINVRGALYGDALNGISFSSSGDHTNIPLDGMIGLTGGVSYKFGFVNKKSILTGAETTAAWIPLTTAVLASQEYADAVKDGDVAKEVAKEYAEQANKTADELYGMIDFGHKLMNLDIDDFLKVVAYGDPIMYCYDNQDGVANRDFIESCFSHIKQMSESLAIKSLLLNVEFSKMEDASMDMMGVIQDFADSIKEKYNIPVKWGVSIKKSETLMSMHIIITK